MKKILATLVMAVLMASMAFAQSENQEQRRRPDPAQMAQRMTEMMAKHYGLNDTQKASLLELNKKYAGKMPMMRRPRGGRPGMHAGRPGEMRGDSIQRQRPSNGQFEQRQRPSKEEFEQRAKEMKANIDAYNAELKGIMTDDQYKQYTDDVQKHAQQRPQK